MPLFFLLSGYLYKVRPFREVVKRNISKIIFPYIVTCLMIFVIKWLCFQKPNWWLSIIWGNSQNLWFLNTNLSVGPLWFLTAYFCAMVYMIMIDKIRREIYQWCVLFAIFSISLIWTKYADSLLPFGVITGVGGTVFIYIGRYLKSHPIFFQGRKYLFTGIFIWAVCVAFGRLAMNVHEYRLFLIQIVGAVYGTYLCYVFVNSFKQDSALFKFLCYIGSNSLAIICIHSIDRVLGISSSLAEIIVDNPGKDVLIFQLDVIFKFCFVLLLFVLFRFTPPLRRLYRIL